MDSCGELVPAIQADPIIAAGNHAEKRINCCQRGLLVVLWPQPVDLSVLGTTFWTFGRKQAESLALCHIRAATLNVSAHRWRPLPGSRIGRRRREAAIRCSAWLGVSFLVEQVAIVLLLALWTQTVAKVRFGVLGDIGFNFLPASVLVTDAFAPHANRQMSPKDFDFPAQVAGVGDEKRQKAEDGDSDERIRGIGGDAARGIHEGGKEEAAK